MTKEEIATFEDPEVAFWKKELDGITKVIEQTEDSLKVNKTIKASFEKKVEELEAKFNK